MNNDLLPYYERELLSLRKMTAEFAQQYPERAAALSLTREGCDDPHVERILEGFALTAGRIQRKLDDEFPEITQSLLELLYPQLVRPLPSMAVVQFQVDPELSKRSTGHLLPRGSTVYSAPIGGVQCRFRTAFPVTLWPLAIAQASFSGAPAGEDARYALRIELHARGSSKLSSLAIPSLRFRLGGDAQAAFWLYELLFQQVTRVLVRPAGTQGRGAVLPAGAIKPVGFGREEAMLPAPETSFAGYRLLQEYFCYPQKFLFFDLTGLDALPREAWGERLEMIFLTAAIEPDRAVLLESAVTADTFQLGCTPAINLFEHCADPIRLSHAKTEYAVTPDVHAPLGMEVYSVDRVSAMTAHADEPREYRPFYSLRHGLDPDAPEAFWFSTRRAAQRSGDAGTDVWLSFVDRGFRLSDPADESVTAHLTCTNRDLPGRLRLTGAWGELDLESGASVLARAVFGPTDPVRPALRGSLQWRLISHLSLNHLSLVDGGVDALRELLRLYNACESHAAARQIQGVAAIRSTRKVARLDSEYGFVFCQGAAIEAELDEDCFAGAGAYLLASVLDRFFGLYCAVNAFTQLRVTTRQRKGVVWQWPLRSGEQAVV